MSHHRMFQIFPHPVYLHRLSLNLFKEPRIRFQVIDSANLCSLAGRYAKIRLSYWPDRLGMDSWASKKVYKFKL